MSNNLTEYFERREHPKSKFKSGDRVFGRQNKIPFIGTVMREEESMALIHTDLPFKFENSIANIISVKTTDIKSLVEIE